MRTVRCSGLLPGGWGCVPRGVSDHGGVCPGVSAWVRGCLPRGWQVYAFCRGGVCPEGMGVSAGGACLLPGRCTRPLWTDRHLWRHNLSATTVADGNNSVIRSNLFRIFQSLQEGPSIHETRFAVTQFSERNISLGYLGQPYLFSSP